MIGMRASIVVIGALVALIGAGCNSQTPTAPSAAPPTSPTTVTWTNTLLMPGTISRSFAATQAGSVSVTLTSLGASPVPVQLGIGIPEAGGGGCILSQTVPALPATEPLFQTTVDTGVFCLKIYHAGGATAAVGFSITLVHP